MFIHVFGPVPSRRLGISLGVDLVVKKTCNLNCIFCECGPTKQLIMERAHFKNVEDIKREIAEALPLYTPDFVTFSGGGEPTLSLDLGEIVRYIKHDLAYTGKLCLLTNGLLLDDEAVLEEVQEIDRIVPSIHATDLETYRRMVRPRADVAVETGLRGIRKLCESRYTGEIYMEVFIAPGINDQETNIKGICDFLRLLRYDSVQLNSLARPGAVDYVKTPTLTQMQSIKMLMEQFGLHSVEIVQTMAMLPECKKIKIREDLFHNMNAIRQCSDEEISKIYKK